MTEKSYPNSNIYCATSADQNPLEGNEFCCVARNYSGVLNLSIGRFNYAVL
jgi:hypothetical protein